MVQKKQQVFYSFFFFIVFLFSCSNNKENNEQQLSNKSTSDLLKETENDTSGVLVKMFDIPDLQISKSPELEQKITFNSDEKVIQTEVAPNGNIVSILLLNKSKQFELRFWDMSKNKISENYLFDKDLVIHYICWHPRGTSIYAISQKDDSHQIRKYSKSGSQWSFKSIFSSSQELTKLTFCPRPFVVKYQNGNNESLKRLYNYRLFFGMKKPDNSYRIMSLTENGSRLYQVVGPKETFTDFGGEIPSVLESNWALPVAFHPAGHILIVKDKNSKFYSARYNEDMWLNELKPLSNGKLYSGDLCPTPNGLSILHWNENEKGLGIYNLSTQKEDKVFQESKFEKLPTIVPDGRGIVAVSNNELKYIPLNLPLQDVTNAWLFSNTIEETNLFSKNSGLFRTTKDGQLFQLYESENYYCDDEYSFSTPTRPFLVTTDIFWELIGSAYQGIFIVKEKKQGIPAFWEFVSTANDHFQKKEKNSKWASVFITLSDLKLSNKQNPEVAKIYNLSDTQSDVSERLFSFSNLKPRGHYTSSEEMQQYFMAFKYLTTIFKDDNSMVKELNSLPENTKALAMNWINSYNSFISNSRSELVWQPENKKSLSYVLHPKKETSIFPLSWGIDNEVLNDCIYHQDFEKESQIIGSGEFRMLPSGIDLAAALGNDLALELMKPDLKKYPPLEKVINNLRSNFKNFSSSEESKTNIYDNWMNAIAIQWATVPDNAVKVIPDKIWETKRLQTGLATWATLRHATILVNETGAAECGEGGFEEIILRAPKGFVEPDPTTFSAMASIFEELAKVVDKMDNGTITNSNSKSSNEALKEGIINRLKECTDKANYFKMIAEKELKNEDLTNEEYENIFYVGRVAEHNFLLFNSLANQDNAISVPDPMAKIADVSGNGPYLMVAVGNPLEWDQIVPFKGVKQIVKGSIYSYYEFNSSQIYNDVEWRKNVEKQEILPWINPYITNQRTSYPASSLY